MQRTVLASLKHNTQICTRSGFPWSLPSVRTRLAPRHSLCSTRTLSTTSSSWPHIIKKSPLCYKAVSLAWTSASLCFLYSQWDSNTTHIAWAEAEHSVAAFTGATPAGIVDELADEDSSFVTKVKSTKELLLALCVYKLCMIPTLVDIAPHLIHVAETLHLQAPLYWIIKRTIFCQFCGGETADECATTMERLSHYGISAILDLSIEADLQAGNKRPPDGKGFHAQQAHLANIIVDKVMECVSVAAQGRDQCGDGADAFAAVKVTAFAPPEFLLRLNQVLQQLDQMFDTLKNHHGRVNEAALRQIVTTVLPPPQTREQAHQRELLISRAGELDEVDFHAFFNLEGPNRAILWSTGESDVTKTGLTLRDLEAYDKMVARLHKVCSLAYQRHIGIMIDAEQSYFQQVIDHVAMNLQATYNRREDVMHPPTVYNTYQMYTKSAQKKLKRDVERARRENFCFAAKLVRGAYMVSERKRAKQLGLPSPIHDTIEDTHASFNNGVAFLLDKLQMYQEKTGQNLSATTAPIVFMVATHNRESIIRTVKEMERHHVLPRSGVVHFGQLYGMQDQISFILGRNGYSIFKYLPYGKIEEVMPYLIRRAQENSAVITSVNKECQLMWQEIKERLLGKAAVMHKTVITAPPATQTVINEVKTENVE